MLNHPNGCVMGQVGEVTKILRLISLGLSRVIEWLEPRNQPEVTEEELLDELSKSLANADLALLVVRQAGFPAGLVPVFRFSLGFWSDVLNAARSGMIKGGIMAVVKAAADCLPGNHVLARYLSSRR